MGLLRLIAVVLAFGLLFSCGGSDEGDLQGSYKGRRGKSNRTGRRERQKPEPPQPEAEAEQPAAAPPPAGPEAPAAGPPPAAPARALQAENFVFPVEASPGAELDIRLNQAKTKVTISSLPAGQNLRVVAGFSGLVSIDGQNIVLNSPGYNKDLVFELGESSIQVNPGDMVTKSQLLTTTSSPVVFSVQKNGVPTILCINIVDESQNTVSVNYHGQGAGSPCP